VSAVLLEPRHATMIEPASSWSDVHQNWTRQHFSYFQFHDFPCAIHSTACTRRFFLVSGRLASVMREASENAAPAGLDRAGAPGAASEFPKERMRKNAAMLTARLRA
jgi:hypothetical protein